MTARGTKDGYTRRRSAVGAARQLTVRESLAGEQGFVYVSFAVPASIHRRICALATTAGLTVNGWLRQTCFAQAHMGAVHHGMMTGEAKDQLELAMGIAGDAERTRIADSRDAMAAGASKPHYRPGRPRKR
jgi:hypothetical protein